MQSDKAIGMFYPDAIRFIDRMDLWHEVINVVTDAAGIVIRIVH